MKTLKYLFAFALPVLAMVAMSSCSEEEASYTPAGAVSGAQVFFHSDNATAVNLASTDGGSFDVVVMRQDTTEALNVPLAMIVDDSLQAAFTAPEAIAFAAGEATTTVSVAYNAALFEVIGYADYKTFILSIDDDENTTAYGISSIEISVGFPEPWSEWEQINTCTYTLSGYWSGTHSELPIYYREYLLNEKDAQFYIPGVADAMNLTIDYDRTTGNCAVKVQQATTNGNYGPVFVSDMPNYPLQAGLTYDNYPCTYNKETGTFNLTLVYFVSADLGSSASGYFAAGVAETIQLDGFEVPDATVSMEYMGVFANTLGSSSAVVSVELGADADSARVAMVPALSDEALAEILAGTVEYQVAEESSFVTFPIDATGTYYVIAVSYMGGEAAELGTLTFTAEVGGAAEAATIEDFEGDWVFPNTYNGKVYESVGNISVVEIEGVNYLLCSGFADAASLGYTSDEFLMLFDAETGLVTLPTQDAPEFTYQGQVYSVMVAMSDSEESTVFGGSLVGKLIADKIIFANAEDNEHEADSFVFYSPDLGLISYFNLLEWTRYEGGAEETKAAAPAKIIGKDSKVKVKGLFVESKNIELKSM